MIPYIISSVGLGFDIVGVVLIWRYGFVADLMRPGGAPIVVDGLMPNRRAIPLSRIALWCLVTGFSVQIVANMVQMLSLGL